jgi:hypothetical protein
MCYDKYYYAFIKKMIKLIKKCQKSAKMCFVFYFVLPGIEDRTVLARVAFAMYISL